MREIKTGKAGRREKERGAERKTKNEKGGKGRGGVERGRRSQLQDSNNEQLYNLKTSKIRCDFHEDTGKSQSNISHRSLCEKGYPIKEQSSCEEQSLMYLQTHPCQIQPPQSKSGVIKAKVKIGSRTGARGKESFP